MWKPSGPFVTPLKLLKPTYTKVNGVPKKSFPEDGELFFCCYKGYGGSQRVENGLNVVEDTAEIETFYNPEIMNDCRVINVKTGKQYEIINEPEDIEQRNQYLKFKIRKLKGGSNG